MASNVLLNAAFYAPAPVLEAAERERLILDHLSNVRWIAMRIHERIGGAVNLEDLISSGVIGLINAVDSYDPKYNVKLKTYAEHRIRGAILDSIRGLDGIPAHKRKHLKSIEAAIGAAEQRLQRVPTEEEIAAEMNMSLAEYQDALSDVRAVSLGSLDEITDGFSEGKLLRYVAQSEEQEPGRILERAELENLVAGAVDKMPASGTHHPDPLFQGRAEPSGNRPDSGHSYHPGVPVEIASHPAPALVCKQEVAKYARNSLMSRPEEEIDQTTPSAEPLVEAAATEAAA